MSDLRVIKTVLQDTNWLNVLRYLPGVLSTPYNLYRVCHLKNEVSHTQKVQQYAVIIQTIGAVMTISAITAWSVGIITLPISASIFLPGLIISRCAFEIFHAYNKHQPMTEPVVNIPAELLSGAATPSSEDTTPKSVPDRSSGFATPVTHDEEADDAAAAYERANDSSGLAVQKAKQRPAVGADSITILPEETAQLDEAIEREKQQEIQMRNDRILTRAAEKAFKPQEEEIFPNEFFAHVEKEIEEVEKQRILVEQELGEQIALEALNEGINIVCLSSTTKPTNTVLSTTEKPSLTHLRNNSSDNDIYASPREQSEDGDALQERSNSTISDDLTASPTALPDEQ
jgi:hypothetical protein